jgi:hypothetical protein
MQAITIAIGKTGINFFAQELVAKELVNLLSALKPPDRTIQVGDITWNSDSTKATNIVIYLTQGSLSNFSPRFQSISQQSGGVFPLMIGANNFSAQYAWEEHYRAYIYFPNRYGGGGSWEEALWSPVDKKFTYPPAFSGLTVTVPLQFEYDNQSQKWSIVAGTSSGTAVSSSAKIPGDSVIQKEDQQCFSSHVSDATASAVSAIDFSSSLNKLIAGTIASIPGSGNLGNGIVYDFSLSDPSQLHFPNNDGIQMGVKGGASYNGTAFSGITPPSLPMPTPPSDGDAHQLNMYVSNYEVDALNWAYYKAGLLNLTITPQDLNDPSVLNVSDYTTLEPKLAPYSAFVMNAEIRQNSAPVTSFQAVYVYTTAAMNYLKTQLPGNVYQLVEKLPSNAFLSKAALGNFLTQATVPAQYFTTIENIGLTSAMVLKQDVAYTLLIQNGKPPNEQPNIRFSVSRTDVLTNLGLGVSSNNTQTMKFGFANAENTVAYTGSSIQGFDGKIFEEFTWIFAEKHYADILVAMGQKGVPLPIMEDFQFDFTDARLSVQDGYISILANVLYKNK